MDKETSETVAVLVGVFNGKKYLDELLKSLLEQDYPHIQIYVRDNCSTDGSKDALLEWKERYPSKINLYFSQENEGVVANFSALMDLAEAPYIMFCDCDDRWLSNKVSKTLEAMKQLELEYGKSYPLLVHTDLIVADANLNEIAPSFWDYSCLNKTKNCEKLPRMLVQNQVTGCTMLINLPLKQLAAPIPLECVMHDWWLALVAACFGRVYALDFPSLYYRQHESNDTGAKSYRLSSFFRRKKACITNRKVTQTELLVERYQLKLPENSLKVLKAYLSMQKSGPLRRLRLMFSYGFFKTGFLRNFVLNH